MSVYELKSRASKPLRSQAIVAANLRYSSNLTRKQGKFNKKDER
ncbi:hypothetical protein [Campylobacter showae]|nr:hypothetical protein [Campylobacter showae]